jgi:hypothetical protein
VELFDIFWMQFDTTGLASGSVRIIRALAIIGIQKVANDGGVVDLFCILIL